MSIDNEEFQKMAEPELTAGFTITFNSDNVNKNEIEKIVKLQSKVFKERKDTKVNPITKEKAPGYILFEMKAQNTRDFGVVITSIVEYLYQFKDELNNFIKQNDGKLEIFADVIINSLKCPYIQLNTDILKKMVDLNANLESSMDLKYN